MPILSTYPPAATSCITSPLIWVSQQIDSDRSGTAPEEPTDKRFIILFQIDNYPQNKCHRRPPPISRLDSKSKRFKALYHKLEVKTATLRIGLFNDTAAGSNHYGCRLVIENLCRLLEQAGGRVTFRMPVYLDWQTHRSMLPKPGELDLIILNGEGSLHDSARRQRPMTLARLGRLARDHYGVRSYAINASLLNNSDEFYDELRSFSGVFVRDLASQRIAADNGVTAGYCPDLTLAYDPPEAPLSRDGVALTDCVASRTNEKLERFAIFSDAEFLPMSSKKGEGDERLRLIDVLKSFKPEKLSRRWQARTRRGLLRHVQRPATPAEFMKWLSSKELVITGRYHTATLCVLTRTPFLFVESNTPKISDFVSDVGLRPERHLRSLPEIEVGQLMENPQFSTGETDSIELYLAQAKKSAREMTGAILKEVATQTASAHLLGTHKN